MAPSLIKRGEYWHIRYTLYGMPTTRTTECKSRSNANKVLAQFILDEEADRAGIPRSKKVRLSVLIQEYLEFIQKTQRSRAGGGAATVLRRLLACVGNIYIGKIRQRQIEKFLAGHSGVKNVTVNRYLTILRKMFSKAVEWEWLGKSPAEKIKQLPGDALERDWFLDRVDADNLIACCDREDVRALVILALDTGGRCAELLNLNWKDIDFQNSMVMFRATKNEESRHVPLTRRALAALKSSIHHLAEDRIFPKGNGDFQSAYRRPFQRAVKAAGLWNPEKQITMHILRHTFASHLAIAGVPLVSISKLLGHRTIEQTQRYAHLSTESQVDAVKALQAFRGGKKSKAKGEGK